ncbi:cell division cycle-associated 7-like protein isoform X2 [Hyperolius riggenbachi]|uniref:cell division cycle-associated 7-like protein isoform X2 n=1 Tax=Hyperolius riggenbachi TaxID=752182 RepID=UPI0035A36AF4
MDRAAKKQVFHPRRTTKKLQKIFTEESDSDDVTFEGFSHKEINNGKKAMSDDDHKDDVLSGSEEESAPPKKRSFGLRIALQFPKKNSGSKEKTKSKAKPVQQDKKEMPTKRKNPPKGGKIRTQSDSEGENDKPNVEDSNALLRRAMNIKENKAVLAQLLAELHSVPDLFPMKTPPPSQKKTSRRTFSEGPIERRTNPTRSARPPENFALENFTASAMQFAEHLRKFQKKSYTRQPLTDEEREEIRRRRRESKGNSLRPVEDITDEELANVADTVKDKVYDKILGSTCHQCRQKTVDTKTFCRNPGCGGVRGQFCGPCLRNRYGEDVREALLDPDWICPPCRDICNCSYCRKRDGRCATGMLIHLAKFSGYDNVKEYLESLKKQMAEDD